MNDSKLLQIELELYNIDVGLQGVSVLSGLPSGRNEHKDILVGHMYDVLAIDEGNRVLTGEGITKVVSDTLSTIIEMIKDAIAKVNKWFRDFWKWLFGEKKKSGGGGGGGKGFEKTKKEIDSAPPKEQEKIGKELIDMASDSSSAIMKAMGTGKGYIKQNMSNIKAYAKSKFKNTLDLSLDIDVTIRMLPGMKENDSSPSNIGSLNAWADNTMNNHMAIVKDRMDKLVPTRDMIDKAIGSDGSIDLTQGNIIVNLRKTDDYKKRLTLVKRDITLGIDSIPFKNSKYTYMVDTVKKITSKIKGDVDKIGKDGITETKLIDKMKSHMDKLKKSDQSEYQKFKTISLQIVKMSNDNVSLHNQIASSLSSLAKTANKLTTEIDKSYAATNDLIKKAKAKK